MGLKEQSPITHKSHQSPAVSPHSALSMTFFLHQIQRPVPFPTLRSDMSEWQPHTSFHCFLGRSRSLTFHRTAAGTDPPASYRITTAHFIRGRADGGNHFSFP
jgi:hypothetical protein